MTSQISPSRVAGDWIEELNDNETVEVNYAIRKKSEQNIRITLYKEDEFIGVDARCLYEALKEYFEPND